MEDVSQGVLEKNKLGSKGKAEKWYEVSRHILAYVKIQKIKIYYPLCQNYSPTVVKKIDFQKVDQHAGGKWLIHDTKRRKDNQLQSLKLPFRIQVE